jgi:hypothetical protein
MMNDENLFFGISQGLSSAKNITSPDLIKQTPPPSGNLTYPHSRTNKDK